MVPGRACVWREPSQAAGMCEMRGCGRPKGKVGWSSKEGCVNVSLERAARKFSGSACSPTARRRSSLRVFLPAKITAALRTSEIEPDISRRRPPGTPREGEHRLRLLVFPLAFEGERDRPTMGLVAARRKSLSTWVQAAAVVSGTRTELQIGARIRQRGRGRQAWCSQGQIAKESAELVGDQKNVSLLQHFFF